MLKMFRTISTVLCLCSYFLVVFSLQENGANVQTYYVTKKVTTSTSCWIFLRCTKYRTGYVKKFRCAPGYESGDNVGCSLAVCDGQTNPEACNINYATSHIKYSSGSLQYSSGGTCNSPGVCSNCNTGFYNNNERCRMCTAISNCDLEECTTSSNQLCTRCEGVVLNTVGQRAYFPNSQKTACNKACSWRSDSTYCYPGTCPQELASSCTCSTGFSGDKCQTMIERPTISFNMLRLTASNGDTVEAPSDVNNGSPQDRSWTNIISPSTVQYELRAVYKMSVSPPSKRPFIKDFSVGITGASVTVDVKRGGRTVKTETIACSGASRDSPDTDLYTCTGSPAPSTFLPLPLQHLDSIDLRFEASNGGKVVVLNLESKTESVHYYNGNSQVHSFTLSVDLVNPYHCTNTPECVDSMLTGDDLFTTSDVSMRWSGWQDADSGIDKYVLEVHELHAVNGSLQERAVIGSLKLNASTLSAMYPLTSVGVYSLTLSAYDKAGNHKSARRIVMYDPSSSVTTRADSKLWASTASREAPDWQTSTSSVRFDWSNRYINTLHHSNKWLLSVDSVSGVSSLYDDSEGEMTLEAINNVQGIVRISTAFLVDHSGGSSIESTPPDSAFSSQGLGQSQTITPSLLDGDTLRFWVQAFDVISRMMEESRTVHFDTSPPIIDDLWLTKGDRLNVSVHSLEDLTAMIFEWIAYDLHSGLESISWKIRDRFEEGDTVHGVQHLTTQGDTQDLEECTARYAVSARGANCYCTPATGCYYRHFHVKPPLVDSTRFHGGIFTDKYKGVHDSDYHIEVTATNHAKLTTIKDFKITIDSSPPLPGHVHEGMSGQQEVDYQQDLNIHVHWAGFFDRESGIKFYQYGFSTACLTEDDFGLDLDVFIVSETSSNVASWRAPSPGRYHVTVLAYNGALATSAPVCSDGVTIDTTPPSISEVTVRDARIVGGLVKTSDNSVWVIDDQRRRSLVLSPDLVCSSKAAEISLQHLSEFPLNRVKNGSVRTIPDQECSLLAALSDTFFKTFYLRKDNELYVNWTGGDEESGIYDYELGLMSDATDDSAPDLLPFTSTQHHPYFQTSHPLLSQAQTFYIALRATNRAGLSSTKVLGPVIVHTLAPSFTGTITTRLDGEYLTAQWETSAFSDPEAENLKYEVAVGTNLLSSVVRPFRSLEAGGSCVFSWPPTCAAVPVSGLHWNLHHSHTYFLSVRVTNLVGLSTVALSEPYLHDVRLPAQGVVIDICPVEEQHFFNTNSFLDTDHQLSTSSLSASWYGFQSVGQNITYRIGVGTEPLGTQVRSFISVGSRLQFTIVGLKLEENQKYFVTVEASNSAGKISSSSNGLFIIRSSLDMSHIIIKDGPWCRKVDASSPSSRDQDSCELDTDYQSSTSVYTAHWARSHGDIEHYPDVSWSLEERLPHSDSKWRTVREYERVGQVSRVFTGSARLSPGSTYRAAVRFCAELVCSSPIYSNGTTIITSPPKPGTINLQHHQQGDNSQITVQMDRFYDPDILIKSEAHDVMERYEWGLSDDIQARRMLTAWKQIESHEILDGGDKMRFSVEVEGWVDRSRCRWMCVMGYNWAGRASLLAVQVHDCSALEPPAIFPPLVLDVLGDSKGINVGKEFKYDTLRARDIVDIDYTGYANILSGVWPRLRHGNYTWAVLMSDQTNPLSHTSRQSIMELADPCTVPSVLQCGHTENNYINAVFSDESLQHGMRYYICVHAGERSVDFENWSEELGYVRACSDGVTVDLSPPVPGTVHVLDLTERRVQVSLTDLQVKWSGFTDVEEVSIIPHSSGVAYYAVALGTTPEGEDVQSFHSVGSVTHVTLTQLQLPNGARIYVSVRASDHVNRTSTAMSEAFVVDSSPPVLTGRQIQLQNRYIALHSFRVCWIDVFMDNESGMKVYWVSLGTKPGYSDIVPFTATEELCHYLDTGNNIREGHQYYLTVEGYNYADLSIEASTGPLTAATTPPTVGVVLDAQQGQLDSTDLDFTSFESGVGVVWSGFQSPGASISHYTLAVGTCPGCDDKLTEFEVGVVDEFYFADLSLSVGVRYFTTVRACTAAGLCSSATSDGFLVDPTPPHSGSVFDGVGDIDIPVQSSRTFLGCKYVGFSDPESGLHHYEWRVGTTPGADDILSPTTSGLQEIAFSILSRDQQLPVGQKLYTNVRAYNKAGGFSEVTSNGFYVDTSPPEVVLQPELDAGFASRVAGSTVGRNALSVHWSFTDPESSILTHHLSLSSHTHVHLAPLSLQLPGFVKKHVMTGLSLQDGCRYEVKVTACNAAGLCTNASSQSVLVDSSTPNTGSLAVETDHAADLRRQVPGWMEWTTNSMNLSWLGYSDLHSGLDSYTLSLGSRPFASDLNQGGTPYLVPHTSEGIERPEGVVQTATVPTQDVPYRQVVFVSITATNKVGLTSEPLLREVRLEDGGVVWLVRRCLPYSCLGHCACGAVHGRCEATTSTCALFDNNTNSEVTVNDVINMTFPTDVVDVDVTPFNSVMAASWIVTHTGGQRPQRYEYSVGECEDPEPYGVFNTTSDRVWWDSGVLTFAVISLPHSAMLTAGTHYCFFVRAWYQPDTFAVFKSDGVLVDMAASSTPKIPGNKVKECGSLTVCKDIDYQRDESSITVSWSPLVLGHSDTLHYIVYIGTQPGAHDTHKSVELRGETKYTAQGLSLESDAVYYSSVLARTETGLLAWAYSDGVQLDLLPPTPGIVLDGTGGGDEDYSSSVRRVSAWWHGFTDPDSAITSYSWCVGATEDVADCSVVNWMDTGLLTAYNAQLDSPLLDGSVVYSKVYAVDAAGHSSPVVVSDGLLLDSSPPLTRDILYLGPNILANPSFEDEPSAESENNCSVIPSWNTIDGSCIKFTSDKSTLAHRGDRFVTVVGSISQTLDNLNVGKQYKVSLYVGYPPQIQIQTPVEMIVTFGKDAFSFTLDPNPCTNGCVSGYESVILWHQHTQRVTARETNAVLTVSCRSLNVEFVLDDMSVQTIDYLPDGGSRTELENHLQTHAVFLPHWASIHVAWHFFDPESPVLNYKLAIGTSRGGTQLQLYRDYGRRTEATVTLTSPSPDASLHLSVQATNAAGLVTLAHSLPITVDVTPPSFQHVRDGQVSDVDYQIGRVISVNWEVTDEESGIKHCDWAIGRTKGGSDVKRYTRVVGESHAEYELKEELNSPHSLLVYSTVRCHNNVGLASTATTDGVRVLNSPLVTSLMVLPYNSSADSSEGQCHSSQDSLRLRWDTTQTQIKSILVGIEGREVSFHKIIDETLTYSTVTLSELQLVLNSLYEGYFYTIDVSDRRSHKTTVNITVRAEPSMIAEGVDVTVSVNAGEVTLDWSTLFQSPLQLHFLVRLGTVKGGSDVTSVSTWERHVTFTLPPQHLSLTSVYVTIAALDACGQTTFYSKNVPLVA